MSRRILTGLLLIVAAALSLATLILGRQVAATGGLTRRVYATADLQGTPRAEAIADGIDLGFLDDDPSSPREFFSVRWEGFWDVRDAAPIDLWAGADDWARIYVDDQLIVERNPVLGHTTTKLQIAPGRGPHRLVVEYGQRAGHLRINLFWSPPGGSPRPIAPEALFRSVPSDAAVSRARLLGTLRTVRGPAWILAAVAVVLFVVAPAAWRRWRHVRDSGQLTRAVAQLGRLSERAARAAPATVLLLSLAAIAWTAWLRWPGLDPKTLWADDAWVAALTKLPLAVSITTPAPLPPAFVALLQSARQLVPDPEVGLQLVPFVAGLAGPWLLGLLVARLTGSRAIGLAALALALSSPFLAHYSIFVKQYSVDFAVTAGLLLAGLALLPAWRTPRDRFGWIAAAGAGAALLSIPSVFVSVPLVHVAAILRARSAPAGARSRVAAIVVAFDLALAAIYLLLLADRSNPALTAIWRGDFLPMSSLAEAWHFLASNGYGALADALPDALAAIAPLAGLGLVALLVRRDTRTAGLIMLLAYLGVLVASAMGRYPIGTDFRGRTVIFSYALTIALIAAGAHAVLRWIPGRRLLFAAAAAAALGWMVFHPSRVEYFPLDHVDLVRALESRAGERDAIVFNTSGAYLAGYYGPWDLEAVRDDSPQNFGVRLRRPLSITLPRGAEYGDRPLEALDQLLTTERPLRAFFFSTRRGFAPVEAEFARHGYGEIRRLSSNVSTVLIEYARGSNPGADTR